MILSLFYLFNGILSHNGYLIPKFDTNNLYTNTCFQVTLPI